MKKKIIFVLVIFILCTVIGVKAYHIVHQNAQMALSKVQSGLKQLAGPHGKYSFSEAHISIWTQSVIIKNVKLSLANGNSIQAKKISITIVEDMDISLFSANDVVIKTPDYRIKIAYVEAKDLQGVLLNPLLVKQGISFAYLSHISFRQALLRIGQIETNWGHICIGSWKVGYFGQSSELTNVLYNIDYEPKTWLDDRYALDIIHVNQLVVQNQNVNKRQNIHILPMFHKTDYKFKAYGVKGFKTGNREIFSVTEGGMNLRRHTDILGGSIRVEKINFNLFNLNNIFSEYLKRINYQNINGFFKFDFSYNLNNSIFTLNDFFYNGHDFLGFVLDSQFHLNTELLRSDFINLQESIKLKTLTLLLQDTGLKQHLFSALAVKQKISPSKIQQETLAKFNNFASGKDFELDRQFYQALANIIRDPHNWMKISVAFSESEDINSLLTMNFLDFFKLINQNNLTISTVSHH